MAERNKDAQELLKNVPEQLQLCFKLAELEREWAGIVGEEYARRSSLAGCDLVEGCAVVLLLAADPATATSMNFLKSKLARMLKEYLGVQSVRIEIKTGKLKRPAAAKPPLPAWRRRAPVVVDDAAVERELQFTAESLGEDELALVFARLKALVERRKNRKP